METVTIRRAVPSDAAVLAETVRQGFESYRAWAPRGWEPPPPQVHLASIRERLGLAATWCALAEAADGEPAGHAAFTPARGTDPRLAHLWMLFLREPWWGTGLAADLLRRATTEATARGYTAIRLYTPAAHIRARAFYEREGWTAAGEPAFEPALALDLVEYRLRLTGDGPAPARPRTDVPRSGSPCRACERPTPERFPIAPRP